MSGSRTHLTTTNHGFTIVELLIIAPIVILSLGAFITAIVNMTGDVLASRSSSALVYNIQDSLDRIEQDVKLSSTFLAINNITPLTSPQGYNNDATNFTNIDNTKGDMLILNTLATNGNPLLATSSLFYLDDQPNDCTSTQLNQNIPMTMNIVYFVKDSSLWRRVIAPANYNTAGCPVPPALPWQQPSCNPTFMVDQPGSSTFCKAHDAKLLDSVDPADFVIEYFNTANATAASSVAGSDPDPAVRNTALQAATTVSASLNIDKIVAGRSINQSGTIRVTRLDINASTIAPVVTPTTPTAPVVSVSHSQPVSAVFTWPTVSGATGYTFKYSSTGGDCNSGSWTTAFSNQNTTTYTATGAHNSVIYGCATATNSAGTSAWSNMASVTIPLWASPVLQNNWSNYGNGYAPAAYTKTSSGLVVLKGMVKSGSGTIFTLPTGYRPATSEYIMFENSSNQTMGRVDVTSSGSVAISVGSNAWFSLDGIAFMPSGATWTNFSSFLNSWVNYSPSSGDTNWANASYLTDSSGRVNTRGLVRAGNSAGGTPIVTLPAGSRPSEYSHIVNVNSNANNHISVDTSGNILAKGGSNQYLALQTIFYPSGRATGSTCTTQWCNLTLQNSWVHYGSPHSTPQYTKASDGMVHVKGLVRSGNTAATMATLPAGYCPAERLLLTAQAADAWSRVDIVPGGGVCTITPSAVSATWTSFDNIKFMAEQ